MGELASFEKARRLKLDGFAQDKTKCIYLVNKHTQAGYNLVLREEIPSSKLERLKWFAAPDLGELAEMLQTKASCDHEQCWETIELSPQSDETELYKQGWEPFSIYMYEGVKHMAFKKKRCNCERERDQLDNLY